MSAPATRGTSGWQVASIVVGALLALIAVALVVAGAAVLVANATARDDDGFFTSSSERLSTPAPVIVGDGLELGDVQGGGGDWAVEALAPEARIRAVPTGDEELFVGIGPEAEVDAYLAGVAQQEVTDVRDGEVTSRRRPGRERVAPPGDQDLWVASASGAGAQELEWEPESGRWSAVLMNADGSPGVAADVSIGVKVGALAWIGVALLAVGIGMGVAAGVLVWLGLRRRAAPSGPAPPPSAPPTAPERPVS